MTKTVLLLTTEPSLSSKKYIDSYLKQHNALKEKPMLITLEFSTNKGDGQVTDVLDFIKRAVAKEVIDEIVCLLPTISDTDKAGNTNIVFTDKHTWTAMDNSLTLSDIVSTMELFKQVNIIVYTTKQSVGLPDCVTIVPLGALIGEIATIEKVNNCLINMHKADGKAHIRAARSRFRGSYADIHTTGVDAVSLFKTIAEIANPSGDANVLLDAIRKHAYVLNPLSHTWSKRPNSDIEPTLIVESGYAGDKNNPTKYLINFTTTHGLNGLDNVIEFLRFN